MDVFLTNCPHLWKQPSVFKSLVRSDHLSILVRPRIVVKPVCKTVSFRDVREHRKLCMDKKMDQFDWEHFTISDDPSENVRCLSETLLLMFNECFPIIKVRISSQDPPYMSPLVKHLCKIRNKNSRMSQTVWKPCPARASLQDRASEQAGQERANLFALNKSVLLMREEVVITPVWGGGGILSIWSPVDRLAMHLSALPMTRKQLTYISSLSTLTISTPYPKSFPSQMALIFLQVKCTLVYGSF